MLRTLATALAAASACGAWADEPSPYYIGISQALMHTSNVNNSATDPVGDYYSSTGLVGGFDQMISRQRVYANAHVNYNKYRHESRLDNTGYGVAAGWDWATIETLSGNLLASANRSLASLDNTAGLQSNATGEKNLLKTEQISTSILWGGSGPLGIQGNFAHSQVKYSAIESLASESSANSAGLGLSYRLGPTLRVGTGVRFSRTETPYATLIDPLGSRTDPGNYNANTANGRNVDLTADWTLTPQTGVEARVSWTHQSNSTAGSLDFSGLTGAVNARYAPTAKLSFNASASRDAGTNASFFNVAATGPTTTTTTTTTTPTTTTTVNGLSQTSQTNNSYSLGAGYLATAKINVTLNLGFNQSRLIDALGQSSDNNTRVATLAASWAVARNWQLGCSFARATSNTTGSTESSYGVNTVGCTAQATLR
ncbi:MAG: hypothetical protein ABUL50_08500 [Rhizobacter sp.]